MASGADQDGISNKKAELRRRSTLQKVKFRNAFSLNNVLNNFSMTSSCFMRSPITDGSSQPVSFGLRVY